MQHKVPSQFVPIIHSLMNDLGQFSLHFDTGTVLVILSLTLDQCGRPDIAPEAEEKLLDFARELADILESRRPDAEPYIAYLFGLVAFRHMAQ